jgi:uncharacterized membrane protein YeaQ/YmgE (transglycosylase-associated protein family)
MSSGRSLRPSRDDLIDVGTVFGLTSLAVYSFRSSFGGIEFLVVGVVGAALGVLGGWLAKCWRAPLAVSVATMTVVYAVVGGAVTLHSKASAGFLPSLASTSSALRAVVTGWKELITTTPPVGSIGDLMVLPFLGGFAAAFVSFVLLTRVKHSALALGPPAVVLGVGIATGLSEPVSVVLHGAAFGAVAVAWMAWKEHRRRPRLQVVTPDHRRVASAALVLLVASAAGLVLAPNLPFTDRTDRAIWRQTVTPPFDPRAYSSPLSGYRRFVKGEERKNEVMFTVEGLPEGVPIRLATMDAYDGLVWQVSAGEPGNPSLNDSGSFERVGVEIPAEFGGTEATVTVTVGKYSDVWIPDVGEVLSLRFAGSVGGATRDRELSEAFRYNRATDTAASRIKLHAGDRYVMKVRLPSMVDRLAGKVIVPKVARIGGAVSVPSIPEKLQSEVVVAKDSGEQIDRIVDLMRDGAYSDGDLDAGQLGSRGGHSAERLNEFVAAFPKRLFVGDAEQYASTLALLFRDVGHLPTRVVMGFRPPRDSLSGPVEVLAKDVDAWVEVPVEDMGWVAVFPTPDRDNLSLTSSAEQQPEPDYRTQNPPPPPLIDPEFDRPATAEGKAKSNKKTEPPSATEQQGGSLLSGPVGVVAIGVGGPMLVVFLAGSAIVGLKARRRRRRRVNGPGHVRIANGWNEVTDLALDLGHPVPSTTTRREAAAFVGAGTGALAQKADAAVWSAGDPTDEEVERYWSELSDALGSMKNEVGRLDRLKAAISLRSLRIAERLPRRTRDS